MRNMITLFLEDTPNSLGQMVKTFDTGDLSKVRSVAHKMKSPVELFGIPGASQDI
jgi:HPt (histidine-containing phosphotransfer) domain-containing protein